MGWKLCGDKKERGSVPEPAAAGDGGGKERGGKEGFRWEEYQHILLRTNIQPKWE